MTESLTGTAPPNACERRKGDPSPIPGHYQYTARVHGPTVQRFWHAEKERIIRAFAAPDPGERVLDVGCGSGVLAHVLAILGARATGIDSNPDAIDFARERFAHPQLDFVCGLADDQAFEPGTIDRIYCMELVEHLHAHQVASLFAQFHQLLRRGGTVLLTTPNYRGTWPVLERVLDRLRLVPRMRDAQHVTSFDRRRLGGMLVRSGLSVERLTTFCTVAPFVSPLGWRLAERIARVEDRMALPFGNLLLALAVKP